MDLTRDHIVDRGVASLDSGELLFVTTAAERDAADRLGERFRPGQSTEVRPSRGMDAGSRRSHENRGTQKGAPNRENFGREGGIRTRDLSVPNAAR
jgi:hypothetical protein